MTLAPYENKARVPEAAQAFDDLNRTFHDYREANEARLADARGHALLEEKLARIDHALDEQRARLDRLVLRAERPALGEDRRGSAVGGAHDLQHKQAFDLYVRAGEASGLKSLESKALSAGSGPDGGYLVPPPAEREILRRMTQVSPIRALASVREISTATFKKAYSTTGPQAGWVTEAQLRPSATSSQVIAELNFPTMELYAMPSATQTLLDDAAVDIEAWIADEVETVFAEQEGTAFITGDGATRPQGILTPAKSTAAAWSWGKLAYTLTGVSAGFAASNPSDNLVDLIYALKAGYRQNASFLMNRKTQSVIRKMKATTGEYLWQPPALAGSPATLMNFPLVEAEDMPDIAADSFSIAFGDFRRGYLIVDRIGIRVLRDPYTTKPFVLFYTTKRVGGGVQDFDAIKLLKFGTA
ncbi:MAG: phage major capsid protein [Alsobacter sp.]